MVEKRFAQNPNLPDIVKDENFNGVVWPSQLKQDDESPVKIETGGNYMNHDIGTPVISDTTPTPLAHKDSID